MDKKHVRFAAIGGGIFAALIIVLIIVLKINAPQIIKSVGDTVVARSTQSVNGQLSFASIDLSLFGATVIHNVILTDAKGLVVASCDELAVDYSFADLIRGNFNVDNIQSVRLAGLQLNLLQNSAGRWNIEDIAKPGGKPLEFRGKLVVSQGSATIATPMQQMALSALEGDVGFAEYPKLSLDLAAKEQNTALKLKGWYALDGQLNLTATADTFELARIQPFIPASAKLAVQGGQLKDLSLSVNRDQSGLTMQGSGSASGLAATLDGLAITEGQGKFSLNGQNLDLPELSLTFAGQKLTGKGQLALSSPSPQINLTLSAQNFNLAAVEGLSAISGAVSFQADISGPVDKITASGSFQMPAGAIGGTSVTNAGGNFRYAGDMITIEQGTVTALGGQLSVAGTYNVKSRVFNQRVSGQNIDSALVTDNSIPGRVDFVADLSGTSVDNMMVSGSFDMKAGKISTIDFSSLKGNFTKRGNTVDLRGVSLVTSGQALAAQGQVVLQGEKVALNLNVSSTGLDLAVIQANAPLKAPVAFQAAVWGTPDKFSASGSFQIASGTLGRINFSSGRGQFYYSDDVLTLENAYASALGGTIQTSGTITRSSAYSQNVSGQNVDAGFFTDGDIKGRANFNARVNGQGDWDNASADGSFSIKNGTVQGLPFSSMTGDFKKRGLQNDFSNINLQLAGGLVKGTAYTDGDYVHLKLTTGDSPLAQLLGPSLSTLIPQQELTIKFRGPK